MTEHPRFRLDELIHQPVRFSIIAALAAAAELEFSFVRDTVQVSDSLLSRYVTQLEGAAYVDVRKGYVGKRPRTWLALSDAGRQAYAAHIDALQALVGPFPAFPAGSPYDACVRESIELPLVVSQRNERADAARNRSASLRTAERLLPERR